MRKIAQDRGEKCLSQKYINSRTKLQWECPEGHQWSATYSFCKTQKHCVLNALGTREKQFPNQM